MENSVNVAAALLKFLIRVFACLGIQDRMFHLLLFEAFEETLFQQISITQLFLRTSFVIISNTPSQFIEN